MTHEERLLACITGGPLCALQTHRCILGGLRALKNFQKLPQLHLFKYEDLVGLQGGGSIEAQKAAITRLCKVAGGNPEKTPEAVEKLYLKTKGIGRWRREMGPEHITAFKNSEWNRWLIYYGYEKGPNWR